MSAEFVSLIPNLLDVEITSDNYSAFFDIVKPTIQFDNYFVYFLNSEIAELKCSNLLTNNTHIKLLPHIARELLKPESIIFDKNSTLITHLNLKESNYILSKLYFKNTVFGFILLENPKDSITNIESISAILSYKLKDIELSNVFKIQQKALKKAVEDTHEAYKTIKNQNKKILAADKIKNDFLASVSHELRTPLNAIIGFSDILKSQGYGNLNEKQIEYVNDIQISGIQLLGMVNEILDITKIEANAVKLVKRYFEISRPIIETTNLLTPLINSKKIQTNINIKSDIDIFADYQKIQQILYNLLSNAIKYTPENGKIEITVTNTVKKVKISVKDSGCGIEKKYHKKIFQKFVQLEDAFYKKETSTGLGLNIAYQLVKMHNGTIKVISEKGKGAEFIVTLPIDSEPQV